MQSRTARFAQPLLCVLAFLAALAVTRPAVEFPFCDDYAYIWLARVLAATGHLVYNGGEAAMLGWQAYYGALVVRLGGASIVAMHAAMLPLAALCVVLLHRVFVRLGVTEANSTLATLAVVLTPLFLPLSFSFMSDIPGLLVLLVCLYACLRAWGAESAAAAYAWLAFAAVSNVAGGTVRQIMWLGALLLVPATCSLLRRRWPRMLAVGAGLWIVSALAILLCTHWYVRQPYTLNEKLLPPILALHHPTRALDALGQAVRAGATLLLIALPAAAAFLLPSPAHRYTARRTLSVAAGAAVIALLLRVLHPDGLAPSSLDWLGARGLHIPSLPGLEPAVVPMPVRLLLTVLLLAAYGFVLLAVRDEVQSRHITLRSFLTQPFVGMCGLYLAATAFCVVTRDHLFDRYLVPLAPLTC